MTLLFDAPLIAGLDYSENLISEAEEEALLKRLAELELAPFRFHGWLGNRMTQSFGWRYDFDDASFAPTEPIPSWLQPLREEAAAFAEIKPDEFVHVLLARYDPGAGIGWHRDRDVFDQVVGISLEYASHPALPAPHGIGIQARQPRSPAALGLSAFREVAVGVGAQHRSRRSAALLDHLSNTVGEGPSHPGAASLTRNGP